MNPTIYSFVHSRAITLIFSILRAVRHRRRCAHHLVKRGAAVLAATLLFGPVLSAQAQGGIEIGENCGCEAELNERGDLCDRRRTDAIRICQYDFGVNDRKCFKDLEIIFNHCSQQALSIYSRCKAQAEKDWLSCQGASYHLYEKCVMNCPE